MSTNVEMIDGDLVVTRLYRAPIEKVFEAWIETSKLKQWWGCAECVEVRSEVEPKPGGAYNHHMVIENEFGRHEAPQLATLIEYDPPNRLAYTSPDDNDPMIIEVDFTQTAEGTMVRLVHRNIPDIIVEGDVPLHDIIRGGWTAAFGKLDALMTREMAA